MAAPLKPDVDGGYMVGTKATAEYIADLMFRHPVLEVYMKSKLGFPSWTMTLNLTAHNAKVNQLGVTPNGGSSDYFDFGIYNITTMNRFSIGQGISLSKSPNLEDADRKLLSEFLTHVSTALRKYRLDGRKPVTGADDRASTTTGGGIRLRLRAAE